MSPSNEYSGLISLRIDLFDLLEEGMASHSSILATKTPPSMGFSRQEYWSGLPFPSQGIFPNQGSNPGLLNLQMGSLPLSHQGSLKVYIGIDYGIDYNHSHKELWKRKKNI